MKKWASLLFLVLLSPPAKAEPVLQLFIQGSSYNSSSETWVYNGNNQNNSFQLWAVVTPGGRVNGILSDLTLSAVYDATSGPVSIAFTPTTTGGLGGFTDSSTPSTPSFLATGTGSSPTMPDGSTLATHGEYGTGRTWQTFGLGSFLGTDSPTGDFSGSFPSPSSSNEAQINVYTVTVTGTTAVHFDLFAGDTTTRHGRTTTQAIFAPFSHDAEGINLHTPSSQPHVSSVPAPPSIILAFSGLLGVGAMRIRRLFA